MKIYECLECGEDAPWLHPEYSNGIHEHSDHLCGPCLIACLEEKYEESVEILRDAVAETGQISITMSFIEAVEKRQ